MYREFEHAVSIPELEPGRPAEYRPQHRVARRPAGGDRVTVAATVIALIGMGGLFLWLRDDGVSLPATDALWQPPTVVTEWDSPPPAAESSGNPLGLPPQVPSADSFAFVSTQPGSSEPVTFDPCLMINVDINLRTAPSSGEEMVQTAVQSISAATGLQFNVVGSTNRAPDFSAASLDSEREWPRVLVAWSDPDEVPELAGATAGLGGAASIQSDEGRWYVDGTVALDGPQLEDIAAEWGNESVIAIIKHELAHVVGLDHVEVEGELMQPTAQLGLTTWGPGDSYGLAQLGGGECMSW